MMPIFIEDKGRETLEKYIYGLAAKFDHISTKEIAGIEKYYYTDSKTVTYAKEVAMTLGHDPKRTLTTTATPEDGELILVQTDKGLYFRFKPSTEEGLRAYRHVKHRRLRQCSVIFNRGKLKRDIENETRAKQHPSLTGTSLYTDKGICLYEVCLTNSPKDTETFCTTDSKHPLLQGIEWTPNIEHGTEDHWGGYVEWKVVGHELEVVAEQIKQFDERIEQLLKQRAEKQKIGGM